MTIATGVAAGLLTAGILRITNQPFARMARLHTLPKKIERIRKNHESVNEAFRDFEYLFAKENGGVSENYDRFFKEIRRSGLIQYIAESSILESHSVELEKAFTDIYLMYVDEDVSNAKKIYSILSRIFYHSIRSMFKDQALAFFIQSIGTHLDQKMEQIILSLNKESMENTNITIEELQEATKKIAKGIQQKHREIHVETNRGRRPVEIKKIFISPKLRIQQEPKVIEEISEFTFPEYLEKSTTPAQEYYARGHSFDYLTVSGYGEFKISFSRAVILGDPGGGKTTLCQNLCYELAGQCAHGIEYKGAADIDHQLTKLPLRIVLRAFERSYNENHQIDLLDYIINDVKRIANVEEHAVEACVKYNLKYGGAVIAFDGLDEILETSKRREFVELVDEFANRFPLCPIFVTSREIGYSDAPLPSDYAVYHLEQLQEDQVVEYVNKFLKIGSPTKLTPSELEAEVQKFIDQTEVNAHDLRKNPLMLGLMVWLFCQRGDVPTNRPEIYKECAIFMFEKWDRDRGIKANVPDDFDLLHLFGVLAAEIYGDPGKEEGVSKEWLNARIRQFFAGQYSDNARAHSAAKLLVDFVTVRSWVMVSVGANVYKFTHRTFLEFFFASHVDAKHDTVKSLISELRPKMEREEWDVVSHLALQLKTHRNPRRVSEATELLGSILGRKIGKRRRLSCLRFVANAIEYLPAPEADLKKLLAKMADEAFEFGEETRTTSLRIFGLASNEGVERRSFLIEEVSHIFAREFSEVKGRRNLIIDTLSANQLGIRLYVHNMEFSDVPEELRTEFLRKTKESIWKLSMEDPFYGYMYLEWYGESVDKVLDRWGLDALLADNRKHSFSISRPLLNLIAQGLEESNKRKIRFAGIDEVLTYVGRLWPLEEVYRVNQEHGITRGFVSVPDRLLRKVFSESTVSRIRIFGGIFLLMFYIELMEAKYKTLRKKDKERYRKIDRSEVFLADRDEFSKSLTGKCILGILKSDKARRQYYSEWCKGDRNIVG